MKPETIYRFGFIGKARVRASGKRHLPDLRRHWIVTIRYGLGASDREINVTCKSHRQAMRVAHAAMSGKPVYLGDLHALSRRWVR